MLKPQSYFADIVRDGWSPRNPCTDAAELARLEQSGIRGNCISPLLQEGDTVFIDRNMKPEPGDIVSFALSARAAAAQNEPPTPADHSPRSPGERWCKLLGERYGLQMLYERHGSEATATFMACESPEATPALHPVRNVMRGGRMMFGPAAPTAPMIPRRGLLLGALGGLALTACNADGIEVPELPAANEDGNASQINLNAVCAVLTTVLSSAVTLPLSGALATVLSLTVGPYAYATSVVVTASGTWQIQAITNPETIGQLQGGIVSTVGTNYNRQLNFCYVAIPAGATQQAGFTDENTYALPIGTTATIALEYKIAETATTVTKIQTANMKAEVILR